LIVSFLQRKQNRDITGDTWNGRTLEWSTASPAPFYNFAIIPKVRDRDAFWDTKQSADSPTATATPHTYHDIMLPKNTGAGIIIAGFAFIIGFAVIWHIWWLAIVGLLALLTCLIIRLSNDDTEYTVPAAEIARLEAALDKRKQYV
jgi:cytochrome o ubiquinol oxidase subunit 1